MHLLPAISDQSDTSVWTLHQWLTIIGLIVLAYVLFRLARVWAARIIESIPENNEWDNPYSDFNARHR